MKASPTTIPFGRKLAFGMGDFGFSLFFLTASLYLLYYYTDVLGLSPAVAGWVFGGALVWDAIFDPIMGGVANRTRSRWGRYRPWLLWGAVPLALSWCLVFVPTAFTGAPLVLLAVAAHILFRTFYAVAYMPYLSLSAAMTRDSTERSSLAAYRMVGQAAAGMIAAFTTLKLVDALGGGRLGFFHVALIYSVAAVALILLVFATAREVADDAGAPAKPGYGAMFAAVRGNRPFWLICAALLMGYVAGVFFNKSIPYYVKYGLKEPELIGPSLGVLAMTITITIPLWTLVMKRLGKRNVFLTGTVIALIAYAAIWFSPPLKPVWLSLLALLGLGTGGVYLSTWAMLPDTVELGEWQSGVRAEGAIFGFVSLAQKTSLGVAAAVLGETLSAIGYRANVAQAEGTLSWLRLVMIAVPAVFATIAAGFVVFYPIDKQLHGRLVKALARRRR